MNEKEIQEILQTFGKDFLSHEILKKVDEFKALNEIADLGGIVFAGDSITEAYRVSELLPKGLLMYNRGIAGITSVQLLQNLNEHVIALAPEKVFILIGTNDLDQGECVDDIASRIGKICEKITEACEATKVMLCSVYPVNEAPEYQMVGTRRNEEIQKLNALIQDESHKNEKVTYINLYPNLVDESGQLKKAYTIDGLHLSVEGYMQVTQQLIKYVE